MTHRKHGFTLIELLVIITLIVVVIAILFPVLGRFSHVNYQMPNHVQGRGILYAMVTFAQDNNTYFPGLLSTGDANIPAVAASPSTYGYPTVANATDSPTSAMRIGVLLNAYYFTPDFLLNPEDSDVEMADLNTTLTSNNQSYAWLEIADASTGRKSEWRDTLNSQAIVLTDRNTASDTTDPNTASSVWTVVNSGNWRGMVVWNDGHTTYEHSAILQSNTRYGAGPTYTPSDTQEQYLFNAASTDDVYVTRSGQ